MDEFTRRENPCAQRGPSAPPWSPQVSSGLLFAVQRCSAGSRIPGQPDAAPAEGPLGNSQLGVTTPFLHTFPCRSFRGHGCERLWDAHLWTQVLGGTGSARFVARGTAPPQSGCALRPPPAWHERVSHLRLSLRPPCAAVISPAVTCLD